jgi:integrase
VAREIIERRIEGRKAGDLLFPMSSKAGEPMKAWSDLMAELRSESGVPSVKLHDLRRLFVSELAEHEVGNADLLDSLLNHRQAETRGGVKGVYQRSKMAEPRRQAMEAWGQLLAHAVEHGTWPREVPTKKGKVAKLAAVA